MDLFLAFLLLFTPQVISGFWQQINDADCFGPCGSKGGLCEDFCGPKGYCCRKGYDDCPVLAGIVSPIHHTCVNQGIGEHSGKAYKCDEWPPHPQESKSFEAKTATSAITNTIQEAPQKPAVDKYKELRGRTCGEEGVEAMNKKRAMHVDTDPFKLDPEISRYAQERAEEWVRKTNGEGPYHRQNLLSCTEALAAGNYNITQLIDGIYSKVDEIDWNDIKDVGHIMSVLDLTMGYVGIGCSPRERPGEISNIRSISSRSNQAY